MEAAPIRPPEKPKRSSFLNVWRGEIGLGFIALPTAWAAWGSRLYHYSETASSHPPRWREALPVGFPISLLARVNSPLPGLPSSRPGGLLEQAGLMAL